MVVAKQNNRDTFLAWAASVVPAQRCKWIEENILKIEQFAVSSRLISGSIFSYTDIITLENINRVVMKNRIFQIKNRKLIKNISDDFKIYMRYCAQLSEQPKQMHETETPVVEISVDSMSVGISSTTCAAKFYTYLQDTAKLADRTCISYVSSIRSVERYANDNGYTSCSLFSEDKDTTIATATELYNNPDFIRYNKQQHNRFSAAINKLLESIGAEIPQKTATFPDGNNADQGTTSAKRNSEILAVLNQHYKYGFKIDSIRELMRFRQFADILGITLPEEDDELKASILSSGTVVGDKLFCESDNMPQELRRIIGDAFSSGADVIYYESLFENEQKWMESHVITSPEMLKEYLQNNIGWRFYAVLALAKTDEEAQSFRTLIKKTVADPAYKNIAVIDALSTPLGLEAFEQYVDYSAMSMYYSGNNGQQSKENAKKAKGVLECDWKDRIHDGQFIVFTYANQDGEKATGVGAVQTILQTIVLNRFHHVQDFTKGLIESQLKLTVSKPIAKYGMGVMEVKGVIAGCEKSVLGKFWGKKDYWKDESLAGEHIVIIKKSVDKMIESAFKSSGKISIGEIYDHLETTFGFSVCNLSAFITGFLLKEYSTDPYRSMDAEGHREAMTPDKLSEMIGNYIGKNPKPTYIVSLTEEEKAFYELTENAWNITANSCSSPQQAGTLVLSKMRGLAYPVWCLEDMDTNGVFDLVKLYIKLVQSKGDEAHDVANEIGKIANLRSSSAQNLKELLTLDNCKKGMYIFLERFEDGKLLNVAKEIGAADSVMADIKRLFSVQYSALWIGSTGEDEIRKLITEYEVVKSTNILLNVTVHSKDAAFKEWRETLKFIGFSCESIRAKKPVLEKFFYNLLRIANYEDMLPEHMKSFLDEMTSHITDVREILNNPLAVFMDVYAPYLEGFTETECEEIKNSITSEMFTASTTASNAAVKKAAEDYRKNQVKSQLYKLWGDKTGGSKNPRMWSEKHRTPILCCVKAALYTEAKKAFSTLNSSMQSEVDIKEALEFLQKVDFFDDIDSADYRDRCFAECVIGDYTSLISDIDTVRDALEGTGISAYEWNDNPFIRSKISSVATAEYNAGGSDKVVSIIEGMDDAELKKWLTDVVRKDIDLGVKIIINREA